MSKQRKMGDGCQHSCKRFQLSIVFPKDLESILVSRREVDANVTLTEMTTLFLCLLVFLRFQSGPSQASTSIGTSAPLS